MLNLKTVTLGAALAVSSVFASAGAYAQPVVAPAVTSPTATPRIDHREAKQENRIADGVVKGELTKRQTRHLEKQQRHIRRTEARAKADGVVTAPERVKLTAMQDHAGADIAVDKKVGASINH